LGYLSGFCEFLLSVASLVDLGANLAVLGADGVAALSLWEHVL
jgi:hypothetical protein